MVMAFMESRPPLRGKKDDGSTSVVANHYAAGVLLCQINDECDTPFKRRNEIFTSLFVLIVLDILFCNIDGVFGTRAIQHNLS
jgi:hypothetical protein